MDKNCEGCRTLVLDTKPYCKAGVYRKDEKDCPCGNCLIKSMCTKSCDIFNEFTDQLVNYHSIKLHLMPSKE